MLASVATLAQFPVMQVIGSIHTMQKQARRWQRVGARIALVPTMGYLHAGHASLVHRARKIGHTGSTKGNRTRRVLASFTVSPSRAINCRIVANAADPCPGRQQMTRSSA